MSRGFLTTAALALTLATAQTAMAYDAGDWIVRAGPTWVLPNDSSSALTTSNGTVVAGKDSVGVGSAVSLGFTIDYMLRKNVSLNLLGALGFEHDLKGQNDLSSIKDLGSIKQLPPTLTLNYHFMPDAKLQPYLGAGINYTYFYDEKVSPQLKNALGSATKLSLDNSFGFALQAGVDYDLGNDWLINGALWYLDISTTAKLKNTVAGTLSTDVDVNPWVVMVGIGKRF